MHSRQEAYEELLHHASWITRLRWCAVAGMLAAAATLHLLTPYDPATLVVISTVVAGYNALALLHSHTFRERGPLIRPSELNAVLNAQFALDIIVLAELVHLTGGVESFLTPAYLVLVPATRRILNRRATFLQATLAVILVGIVFWLEYAGRLEHSLLGPVRGPHLNANGAYAFQTLVFQASFLYLGVYIADRMNSRLRQSLSAERDAQHLALTDGLTGLYNRRSLYRQLLQELRRSRRHRRALSVVMFDLDNFKQYNDQYGHLAGDDALRHLADLTRVVIRDSDTAFRYGGEEFVLVLPETAGHDALALAERLRCTVQDHTFVMNGSSDVGRITISAGVATYPEDAHTVEGLIHAADVALLRAKQRKNQVCAHSGARLAWPLKSRQSFDDKPFGEPFHPRWAKVS